MTAKASEMVDVDALLDEKFGPIGSGSRAEFRKEAYNYCVGRLISETRRQEKMTQSMLADKIGASKSYVSRIEKGQIEPGVATFFRIIEALGLRLEIVRPIKHPYNIMPVRNYLSDVSSKNSQ